MALGSRQLDPERDGALEIDEVDPNVVEVYFVPPEHSLLAANLDPKKAKQYRTKLLEISGQRRFLTIHPIGTFGNKPDFLKPKYGQVERVKLAGTDIFSPASTTPCQRRPKACSQSLKSCPRHSLRTTPTASAWRSRTGSSSML